MLTINTIQTVSTKELVAFYNEHCHLISANQIIKFSDRKSAEKRVAALLAVVLEKKTQEAKEEPKEIVSAAESRRASIAKSWSDPVIRVKRSTRNAVIVNGTHYRSCWEAWQALQLGTVNECIRFRGKLKNELKKSLTLNAETYTFEIC
ncbi:hypothetical protein FK091_23815 [Salmonella enterica]|nr:hypothetical protein [Salmonella enterica]EDY6032455.1 hypothetical protein [Salmonella enterica]MEA22811.1 hypothetical protein [Salmonella enterica]MLG27067.1 hypothetical protein [Salmonella enterica]